ncbi:MAG: magnesium transporter [Alphaproteobacteria bacterium]
MQENIPSEILISFLNAKDGKGLREYCAEYHPAVIADAMLDLDESQSIGLLKLLGTEESASVFCNFDVSYQIKLAETFDRKFLAGLIAEMSSDDRVDLIKKIPDEYREALMPALAHAEREDIRRLSSYTEETCGSVMTSEYVTLSQYLTASEAIAKLQREAPDKETIYVSYVVDKQRKIEGFVSLKDLIVAKPNQYVKDIMQTEVITVYVTDDQEEASKKIAKYGLLALPVVDANEALVGIVTYDDAIDIIHEEHTEDLEKFMAIVNHNEEFGYLNTPVFTHFRNRGTWVFILAFLGFVSGAIIHLFEGTLFSMMILALYMPMIADTGGNTGSQSATLVIRALAMGEISFKDLPKIIFKELKISILLGFTLGAVAFAKVIFLSQGTDTGNTSLLMIGAVIAIAVVLQVISSTVIGCVLPLIASKLKQDPAVVASPAITTIVDISGLIIYFNIAKLMLGI